MNFFFARRKKNKIWTTKTWAKQVLFNKICEESRTKTLKIEKIEDRRLMRVIGLGGGR